ncbi:hypothetical protein EIN_052810 [Entamoeba invadens IP1]|uniref:hypothetical protein n=1 Tax=Entamoeba invadens IP1 TaxID=370355 RepID=UPI0002C3DA18|nr:hypothetical protein EIN_052810 [Entamoeba invadens IP1]ELP93066.1 hypothetical protein EIN_052810 [Entamoeba invadens IP1]|eukprot:XP_004259837.1 hypothetical protein EIN_052810 [Entamoeba invadens IP1]
MKILEQVFIKNVVLYLETKEDVINLILVNKTMTEAINTMYINPYKLTTKCSIQEVLQLFPALQTLYLYSGNSSNLNNDDLKSQLEKFPIIDLNLDGYYENTKGKKIEKHPLFNIRNIFQKIRKLRVNVEQIKARNFNLEACKQLTSITVIEHNNKIDSAEVMSRIAKHKTLKTVVLILTCTNALELIKRVNFSEHMQTNYKLIVIASQKIVKEPNYINFTQLPENVKVYTTYISKNTIEQNIDFVPLTKCVVTQLDCGIKIMKDVGNHVDYVTDILQKCLTNKVRVASFGKHKYTEVNDYADRQINTLDLSQCETISEIEIKNVHHCVITVPNRARNIFIQHVNKDTTIEMANCRPSVLNIFYCKADMSCINDDNIKELWIDSLDTIQFKHKNQIIGHKYVVNLDIVKTYIVQNYSTPHEFVLEKGGKVITSFSVGVFEMEYPLKLQIDIPGSLIDLTQIPLNEFTIYNDQEELLEFDNPVKLGDVKDVSISGVCLNDLSVGNVNSISLSVVKIRKFKIISAKYFSIQESTLNIENLEFL